MNDSVTCVVDRRFPDEGYQPFGRVRGLAPNRSGYVSRRALRARSKVIPSPSARPIKA